MPTAQRVTLLAPWLRWLLLLLYLLFTLLPIVWLLLSTIQTQASLLRVPPRILPESITLRNYIDIFKPAAFGENRGESTFLLALRNSIWVSQGTAAPDAFWHIGGLCLCPFQYSRQTRLAAHRAWLSVTPADFDDHSLIPHVQKG